MEMASSRMESRKGCASPGLELLDAQHDAAAHDHQQRQEQAEGGGGLDPAGEEPRLPSGACSAT